MHNYLDLTGKAALVTGASSGIGAATAAVLADLGASVAIGYHRNQKGAQEVCAKIAATGAKVVAIQADMRNADEIARMVKSAAKRPEKNISSLPSQIITPMASIGGRS